MGKVVNFTNKILVSQHGFKLGVNEEINKPHDFTSKKSLSNSSEKSLLNPEFISNDKTSHDYQIYHKISTEEHEEEKIALIVVGTSLFLLGIYILPR